MTNPLTSNLFSGMTVEYSIPKSANIVFVSDFFASDLLGGAELTTEAIIKSAPPGTKPFKLHSASLTPSLLERNTNKHFVLCNFSQVPTQTLNDMIEGNVSLSVVEYDFKYCAFRSEAKHFLDTGHVCNCEESVHGKRIENLYNKAHSRYWMSDKQRYLSTKKLQFTDPTVDVILSSVFLPETIDSLRGIAKGVGSKRVKDFAVLAPGGSWIKGSEQTQAWCKVNKKKYTVVGNSSYIPFLTQLGSHEGFAFMPLDCDTCPRVVIEAKLLGMDLVLNKNVLHKDEPWFAGSVKDTEAFLRTNVNKFWSREQQ